MRNDERSAAALKIVGIVLYMLAAIVAVLGVYMGLALANAPATIYAATIVFRNPVLDILWDALASGLVWTGIVLLVISLIISALLVASGLLLRRSLALSRRIRQLEVALERANIPIAQPINRPIGLLADDRRAG